jgi:integrase
MPGNLQALGNAFVSPEASPYVRFRRSRETRDLTIVLGAAAQVPWLNLDDSLEILTLMAREADPRFDRAAARSERTNAENAWRIGVVLKIAVEGVELRQWPMSDIRRRHALAVQAKLLDQGRSAEGATGILRAMSAMVNDAVDDEVCDTNPWLRLGVRLNDPRVSKAPRAKRMWTMEQMHAFAAAMGPYEAMGRVLSDCGLRLGELPGLQRRDLSTGWLHVGRTAHEGRVQAGTKTTHHKREDEQGRDVPVPPTLEAMLRAAPPRIDTPLLFPTPTGKVWRERNWRRDVWAPAQEATGMDCRPQEFRASWESIMRAEGVDPADLAKYAGHSIATANSRYVQALDRSADQIRKVIG